MPFHGYQWWIFAAIVFSISWIMAKVNTKRGYGKFWRMLFMASIGVTGIGFMMAKIFVALFDL